MEKNKRTIMSVLQRAATNTTVEPYVFFCHVAYIVRLLPFQDLLMDRSCRSIFRDELEYDDDICRNLEDYKTEKELAVAAGNNLSTNVMIVSRLPAAVVAIFMGPWSDKYSRKYPMIIAAAGLFLEALANTIMSLFPNLPPILYAASAIFGGLSGGVLICVSSAYSYISDITNVRNRAARFAVVEFAILSAVVVGSVLGGQIYKSYGYLEVLSFSPVCYGFAILYTIIFVKETKPPVPRARRFEMVKDLLRLDNIKKSYFTFSKKRSGNLRLQILLLFIIGTWMGFTDRGTFSISLPFAKERYDWDVTRMSTVNNVFYVVMSVLTVSVVPALSNRLKLHEAALGLIGAFSLMSKLLVCSLAYKESLFYIGILSGSLSSAIYICVKSRLSKLVNKEEVGSIFSLLGTCESFTPFLGPVIFLQLFNASKFFPGFAFALAGISLIPCAVGFTWMMRQPTISFSDYGREIDEKEILLLETIASSGTDD